MTTPFGKLGFIDQCRWHMRHWDAETADPQSLRTMASACHAWIRELDMVYDAIWRSCLDPECFAADRFVEATMIELAVCRVYIAWAHQIAPYPVYRCDREHEWVHRAFCPECGRNPVATVREARPRDWIFVLGSGKAMRR